MKLSARIGLSFLFLAQMALIGFAQSGIITTYAGPGLPVDGSLATTQSIEGPASVTSDGAGGFYVAISSQNRVYRVTAAGKISLIAGNGTPGFSGDSGPATAAQLFHPMGLALDSTGNLYITDSDNARIREVTTNGVINTVAGNGIVGYGGDAGQATEAEFSNPMGLALDPTGNLYIADSNNHRIRKITASNGIITTVAGNGIPGFYGDTGAATAAQLWFPTGVAIDTAGNMYIADYFNQRIREVTVLDQLINTVAGIGTVGFSGDGGAATSAQFSYPLSVSLDGAGNLFIADIYNFRIRKLAPGGVISTVAGVATVGFSGDGGPANKAQLNQPFGLAVDTAGNLLIADFGNQRVRKVTSNGVIQTVAGIGIQGFSGDGGPATSAALHLPTDVALDTTGNLFIADSGNARIRKVTPGGIISTVAGNGTPGYSGEGGQATSAQLYGPAGVATDAAGNLFIADYLNQRVFKVTPGNVISTIAGNGTQGFNGDGGSATAAQLNEPWGIAVDAAGNLFIADLANNRIRKVTTNGVIGTVAGIGVPGFSGDGGQATLAQLYRPVGVAVDGAGNLFIADSGNNCIRMVTPGGIISTVAGTTMPGFGGDGGAATLAQLYNPTKVVLDSVGNLFISDMDNNSIRRVTPGGIINTVAGLGTAGFSGDGGLANAAQLNFPMGMAINSSGNLFLADYDNNRIRMVLSASSFFPQVAVGSGFSTIFAVTNRGSSSVSGTLIFRDPQGNPLSVKGTLTDFSGTALYSSSESAFALEVPAGKTVFLSTGGLAVGDPVKVGWAQLSSTADLTGTVTYQYLVDSKLRTVSGALQSQPMQSASIPVDNDSSQDRQVAYAIANPGDISINVELDLVKPDGTIADTIGLTLGPGEQTASYLWQDLPCGNFKGTVVIQGQAGASFIAVAVLDNQGLLTAVPLMSGKIAAENK
jgi:sugar lactone lactonase YvrE